MEATKNLLKISKWPQKFHKNIVLLIINNKYSGTGTIVQKGIIITCARNFIGRDPKNQNKKKIQGQYKYRYKYKLNQNLLQIKSRLRFDINNRKKLLQKQNDFAILHYQHTKDIIFENIILKWYPSYFTLIRQKQQKDLSIYLEGYKIQHLANIKKKVLYGHQKNQVNLIIDKDNSKRIKYQMQTSDGMLGSPIILVEKQTGKNYLVCIHTEDKQTNSNQNSGIELNTDLKNYYHSWKYMNQSQDQLRQKFKNSELNLEDEDIDTQFQMLMNNWRNSYLNDFQNLKHLNLRKNKLQPSSLKYFYNQQFQNLLSLVLSQNNVANGIMYLQNLQKLKLLHLSDIKMISLEIFFFISQNLVHLEDLDLSRNPIGYEFQNKQRSLTFSKFNHLKYLSLAKIGLKIFRNLKLIKLKQLRSIDLRDEDENTDLTGQIQEYLDSNNKNWPKLQEICYDKKSNNKKEKIKKQFLDKPKFSRYKSLIRQSNQQRLRIYNKIVDCRHFHSSYILNSQKKIPLYSKTFILVDSSQQFPFFCVGVINQLYRIPNKIKQAKTDQSIGTMVSDNLIITSKLISDKNEIHFFPGMAESSKEKLEYVQMIINSIYQNQNKNYNLLSANIKSKNKKIIPYLNITSQYLQQYKNVIQICYKRNVNPNPNKKYLCKDPYMRILNLTYNNDEKILKQKQQNVNLQLDRDYIIQGSPLLIYSQNQYKLLGITTMKKNRQKYIHFSQFSSVLALQQKSICYPSNLNLWHEKINHKTLIDIIQRSYLKKVVRLDLGWNYLNDQSVKILFECKDQFTNLQQLNLNTNRITNQGMKNFSWKLFPQLKQLLLANNFIENQGFKHLYDQIPKSKIKTLDIRNNNLKVQDIEKFLGQVRGTYKKVHTQNPSTDKSQKPFNRQFCIVLEDSFFEIERIRIISEQIISYNGRFENSESRIYIYNQYLPRER